MKKILIIFLMIIFIGVFSFFPVFGQQAAGGDEGEPGVKKYEYLTTITIEKFEDVRDWKIEIPNNIGYGYLLNKKGKPAELPPVDKDGIENKYVLGAKVLFTRRQQTRIFLSPPRPKPIPGIAKSFSIWVLGRNFDYKLYIIVRDHYENRIMISFGSLNFSGWKKLTAIVSPDIVQEGYHYMEIKNEGLMFEGLLIITNPYEMNEPFYVYFDELSAVINTYSEAVKEKDDIVDNW